MNDWLDAEQRVERAQHLFECHRWDEALVELDAALAINPHNSLWHAQRGYALEELERDSDAADAYRRSLEIEPGDGEVAFAYAATLARLGRLAESLELFEELAKREPGLEPVYCHRIHLYAELGRHEKAEEVFYLSQQLDEECPDCFFNMGGSLAARGLFDRAIFCWKRTLELDPTYPGVQRKIGQAYRSKEQFDLAAEFLLKELRNDPGSTDLLYELAELSLHTGDVDGAVSRLTQLLELDAEHLPARFLLGKIHLRAGRAHEALEAFEDLHKEGVGTSNEAGLSCAVGEALMRLGRFADARTRLEAAHRVDPADPRAALLLGDANLALDRPAAAAELYRRLLAAETHNPFAHHRLAVCLLKLHQPEAALSHGLDALKQRPGFVEAMYHVALAHLRLHQWRPAREWLSKAERTAPGNPAIRELQRNFWRYRLRHWFHWFRR